MSRSLPLEIEKYEQRTLGTHRDFVWLSQKMHATMGEYVSPTTLKRLWGHQRDYCHPSTYTLNFLSRYLGYADYQAFLDNRPEVFANSNMITDCYMTANLTKGDCLKLNWKPNRMMCIRYLGDDLFEVYEAANCKVSVGDTFMAQSFINGETLTLSQLTHCGCGPYVYIVGKQDGVSIEPIVPDE